MELLWFVLKYEIKGDKCIEYFPTAVGRARRERELKELGIEVVKEKQALSV